MLKNYSNFVINFKGHKKTIHDQKERGGEEEGFNKGTNKN
jgi:hypothetical protein